MKVNILAIEKDTEVDDFEKGLTGEGDTVLSKGKIGVFNSIQEALAHLNKVYDFPKDLDGYFTTGDGELSTNRMEDEEGVEASESEIARWKKGELKLYLSDFRIRLEIIKDAYTPSMDEMVKEWGVGRD